MFSTPSPCHVIIYCSLYKIVLVCDDYSEFSCLMALSGM